MSEEKRLEAPPSPTGSKLREQSEKRLLWLVLFGLVFVGGSLIALIYGPLALVTALPFLLLGAGLILVPYLLLKALEVLMRRLDRFR